MFVLILNLEDVPFCNTQIIMKFPQQLLLKVLKCSIMLLFWVENVLVAKLTILLIMKITLKLEALTDRYTLIMQNISGLENLYMLTEIFQMLLMLSSGTTAMENKAHSKLKDIKFGRHFHSWCICYSWWRWCYEADWQTHLLWVYSGTQGSCRFSTYCPWCGTTIWSSWTNSSCITLAWKRWMFFRSIHFQH